MAEEILKTNIPREKGWLYYTKTDEKGNLTIWKARMKNNKGKK